MVEKELVMVERNSLCIGRTRRPRLGVSRVWRVCVCSGLSMRMSVVEYFPAKFC
jgi:hypothetical protein